MYRLSFILLFALMLSACSTVYYPSAEVEFIRKNKKNIVELVSLGYGKNTSSALRDSERKAFEVLLFVGLPNSEQNRALVGNEKKAKSNHSEYFLEFFERKRYRKFITFSHGDENSVRDKKSGLHKCVASIGINVFSLRKDLEQNGIIKKLGY